MIFVYAKILLRFANAFLGKHEMKIFPRDSFETFKNSYDSFGGKFLNFKWNRKTLEILLGFFNFLFKQKI